MANIKLKNASGVEQTYNGVNTLTVPKADSGSQIFTAGEAQEKSIALNMPDGANQIINPDTGKVLSKVTIVHPSTLIAGNIKKDVNIGGVVGTFEGGGGFSGYIVTFINGATQYAQSACASGGSITAPLPPTSQSQGFVGWSTTDGGSPNVTFPYTPSASITLYACYQTWTCTVSGLGSSSTSDVTFSHSGTIPTFETVTQDGNTFIKIPTMYRKINSYSSNQITSFTISTGKIDDTYYPYSVFIKEDGTTIMPWVLMGKYYSSSDTVMNSVGTTIAYQTISNARTNARALNPDSSIQRYQQYDWQFQKLWQDLIICKMNTININSGSGLPTDSLGFYWGSVGQWIDGICRNNNTWKFSMKPSEYIDQGTSNYSSLGYSAPGTSSTEGGEIQKLGYDSSNPFVNYPSAITTSASYNTYYCDAYSHSSSTTNAPGHSRVGGAGANYGAFRCGSDASWSNTSGVRLCYRPL